MSADDAKGAASAWRTEGGSLYHRTADGTEALVTTTVPHVLGHALDDEDGTCYTTVSFSGLDGRNHTCTLDRGDLLTESRIVGALAPLGADVTSENARLVVGWLTDGHGEGGAPVARAATHLGWVSGSWDAFLPFAEDDGDARLVVPRHLRRLARAFVPSGTTLEWARAMREPYEGSMAFRAMLSASAAAPLVRMLGLRPFALYLFDGRNTMAYAALAAAGSVWGDASAAAPYLMGHVPPLADALDVASFLRDVPYLQHNLLPDTDASDAQAVRAAAAERLRAHVSGRALRGASSVTLAAGEMPLTGVPGPSSPPARVLEIDDDTGDKSCLAPETGEVAMRLHGTVGRGIARVLAESGADEVRRVWEAAQACLGPLVLGEPAREPILAVCLGDALLRLVAFLPERPSAPSGYAEIAGAEDLCRWLRRCAVPRGRRYVDHTAGRRLARWVRDNQRSFAPAEAAAAGAPGHYADRDAMRLVVRRATIADLIDGCCDAEVTLYDLGDKGIVSECPRPSFDHADGRDPGNDWYAIDVHRVLGIAF